MSNRPLSIEEKKATVKLALKFGMIPILCRWMCEYKDTNFKNGQVCLNPAMYDEKYQRANLWSRLVCPTLEKMQFPRLIEDERPKKSDRDV